MSNRWDELAESARYTVVKYFLEADEEGGETIAAHLLDCVFCINYESLEPEQYPFGSGRTSVHVHALPRAFRYFCDNPDEWEHVAGLIGSSLRDQDNVTVLLPSLKRRTGMPGWDALAAKALQGSQISNQAAHRQPHITDDLNLRYRSNTELVISQALRRRRVLFFPLPAAVLDGEKRLEPDFLVCHDGRWGILEVHSPFHQKPHEDFSRFREFRKLRILCVEPYDWEICQRDPDGVVTDFLELLGKFQ